MVGIQSKAERIAMIREAAKKVEAKRARPVVKAKRDNEDERLWTDAAKYADQYYGETYRGTTRYDNEWG